MFEGQPLSGQRNVSQLARSVICASATVIYREAFWQVTAGAIAFRNVEKQRKENE